MSHDGGQPLDAIVLGGGLAGLTAAFRLAGTSHSVTLLEAAPRLGGQILTEQSDGFVIEHGAEGFVANGAATLALIDDLGLRPDVVDQASTRTLEETPDGALVELAPGEAARRLGFQVPRRELGRGIRSLCHGMGQLSDTLAARVRELGGRIELGTVAQRITTAGGAFEVTTGKASALSARRVVVAVPARAAAALLGSMTPAAGDLAEEQPLSSVSVALAYDASDLAKPLDASGVLLAAKRSPHGARAFSVVSSKFAGRAPAGRVLLRVFFRPRDEWRDSTDDDWLTRAADTLAPFIRPGRAPVLRRVCRWLDALPVHSEAHRERVSRVDAQLETSGAIRLAGSAFHGAGIEGAVASAERAVRSLREV